MSSFASRPLVTYQALLGPIAGSVVMLTAFVLIERRVSAPVVEFPLFASRNFVGANLVALIVTFAMLAQFFFIALYLQNILGLSPLQTGLRFLPLSLLSFVVAPIAGRLSSRVPVRLIFAAGMSLVGASLLLMHGVTHSSSWTTLLPGFIVGGIGIGLVNAPLASTAVSVVEPRRAGMASGINNTFRQVGIATGIAALGAIFQDRITSHIAASGKVPAADVHRFAQAVSSGAAKQALSAVPPSARAEATTLANSAFIAGLNEILLIASFVLFAGAVLAFMLVRRQDFVASAPAVAPEGG